MATSKTTAAYLAKTEATRARRMRWWHDARFGMFIHWGLYAQCGRNEWVMNLERIPVQDYEKLADTWQPKERPAREWAALAKAAGMKYMVMTTKHHEGFLLWDSRMSDYNAVKRGPGRDLVREYVEAAREFGLKVGFYYSLMDWHHPDGATCVKDEAARRRFVDYTHGCVRELMSNYGKIDILWYDVSWPLRTPEAWESVTMNAMARQLQPHIIINDRSQLPEDFGTPEEHITAAAPGRAWEACMTFNGSWGWQLAPPEDWLSTRKVLDMLRTCAAGGGNLLLNIGPLPDGSVPREATERLTAVGQWLQTYGGVIYGKVDRAPNLVSAFAKWSRQGRKHYLWVSRWPGRELAIGALAGKVQSAKLYPTGERLPFTQVRDRLVISGLPAECPDRVAGVGMLELEFRTPAEQWFSAGCVWEKPAAEVKLSGKWISAPVTEWRLSPRVARPVGGVAKAPYRALGAKGAWQSVKGGFPQDFVNVHDNFGDADGLVYLANRFSVARAGTWTLHLGHDGGVRVFVDGKAVLCVPERKNPALPGRSAVELKLARGTHEVSLAFDLDHGLGWGIFASWGVPPAARAGQRKPTFPQRAG